MSSPTPNSCSSLNYMRSLSRQISFLNFSSQIFLLKITREDLYTSAKHFVEVNNYCTMHTEIHNFDWVRICSTREEILPYSLVFLRQMSLQTYIVYNQDFACIRRHFLVLFTSNYQVTSIMR